MTDTIDVSGSYVVGAEKTLSFVNQDGFHLLGDTSPSKLTIAGSVSVSDSDSAGETFGATTFGAPDGQPATVVIKDGGVLDLQAENQAVGVELDFAGSRLINQGRLQVSSAALFAAGMEGTGDVVNSGQIIVASQSSAAGLYLLSAETVSNSGVIRVAGVDDAEGVRLSQGAEIDNQGKIIVTANGDATSIGIWLENGDESHDVIHVENSGLIRAYYAIELYTGAIESIDVDNSGVLRGEIVLGLGDDHIQNTGHIAQSVNLGGGDDVYDGALGVVDGALSGQAGDDILIAGKGQNVLIGGAGADTLTGGGGADRFVFETLADSKGASRDVITDLTKADIIDVSAIDADSSKVGDQAFHLVAALDGHAGELALIYDAGTGVTTLVADVNGDGKPDLAVSISGDHTGFTHFVF